VAPAVPDFEATEFWHQLVATTARRAGAGDAPALTGSSTTPA